MYKDRDIPVRVTCKTSMISFITVFSNVRGICRTYSPGHNILELNKILVQIRFTRSKSKLDI